MNFQARMLHMQMLKFKSNKLQLQQLLQYNQQDILIPYLYAPIFIYSFVSLCV